jgi:mono/diheme cytochrome c family protein
MTEVPEHLLRRAKERRAALAGGEGAAASDAGATESSSAPAPAAVEAAPAPEAAAAPVPAVPEAPAVPSETYVREQAIRRSRIPLWATPVLFVLPFWAILYAGAFGDREATHEVDPLQLGAEVYRSAGCSSCHGAAGEGGVGPALAGDSVEQTFPDEASHEEWVRTGSIGSPGAPKPYGDPNRPGGQRMSRGGMQPFASRLTPEQIAAVVQYEREQL